MTPQERIDQATAEHAALEQRYYTNSEISKEEFDALHGQIWDSLHHDLNDMGCVQPQPDWQQEWDNAPSAIEKLHILARMAGLDPSSHPLPPNYL